LPHPGKSKAAILAFAEGNCAFDARRRTKFCPRNAKQTCGRKACEDKMLGFSEPYFHLEQQSWRESAK
jgi:hypothetical protein